MPAKKRITRQLILDTALELLRRGGAANVNVNALAKALGDKSGIMRYGSAYIPMDESLAFCCLDISARPFLVFDAKFTNERVGEFDTCLAEEFMRAFAFNAGITLHIKLMYGSNDHHKIEAIFKSFARALKEGIEIISDEVASSKGVL